MRITEFLLARVAEDEAAADWVLYDFGSGDLDSLTERVLAECQAKRAIIERVATEDDGTAPPQSLVLGADVLKDLAAVYADHPDYQEEWRP